MNQEKFVYVTYIATTTEKVWQALMDGELTRQFWKSEIVSDWTPGSSWQHIADDGKATVEHVGTVLECIPGKRLAMTWVGPANAADLAKHSKLAIDIDKGDPKSGELVRLTVTHEELTPEVHRGISFGWPLVLSSLKSLLETGRGIDY
ncbi:SRPBCC domain-containing protein [Undibacterium sp. Ji42W]|uniref:SRPBCC domain-containing protein n=1 Tax=Undibacterium sp. Ji42W TaxID=3413039 RepID=UPI003BF0E4D9